MLPATVVATLALTALGPRDLATTAHRGPVADLAFTADGGGFVSVDNTGIVVLRDLTGGSADRVTRLGVFPVHAAPQFAVSPNGRYVAVGSSIAPPRVFDSAGKPVATLPQPLPDADAWFPAFSGDGKRVAFGYERGHGSPHAGPAAVPVWDVAADRAAGTVELPLPPGGIVSTRLALSADGSRLAAVTTPAPGNQGSETELGVWDVATGKRVGTRILPHGHGTTLAFFPDSRSLLVSHATGFAVWVPDGDRWRWATARAGEHFGPPALSPDGRTLFVPVVTAQRKWTRQDLRYDVVETATLHVRFAPPRPTGLIEPNWWAGTFRPDGRAVAVGRGDRIQLYDLAAGGSTREWTTNPAELWAALAGPAPQAGAAVWALVRQPDVAVALFREKFRPAAAVGLDAAATTDLIRHLDAPGFADREAAQKSLAAVARLVEPQLRASLAAATSPEQKERLAVLLAAADKLTPDELRQVRTVEVLERIGTPEAAAAVRILASGAENAVLTREAKETLARMTK